MEEQEILKIGISELEPEKLKPVKVQVQGIRIDKVQFGSKENQKVVLICKHPDREEPIQVSKVRILKKDKLTYAGLWVDLAKDEKFSKNSATAELLRFANANSLNELIGKEFETVEDEEGFLCIKAYN